jgi:hypothetical protein
MSLARSQWTWWEAATRVEEVKKRRPCKRKGPIGFRIVTQPTARTHIMGLSNDQWPLFTLGEFK